MSLRKRNGQWWYRVFIRGREVESRSTGLAATNSNRKIAEKISNARRSQLIEESKSAQRGETEIMFADAAAEFINWCRDVEYRSKPNSAHRIKTSFASLVALLGERLVSSLTPADVEKFKTLRMGEHQVRNSTIRNDLMALRVFQRYARKAKWLTCDLFADVKIPGNEDTAAYRVVTEDEENRYFAAASGNRNLYDVARLMLLQGCRPEEIMSLRPEHVDLTAGTMAIAGGKTRAAKRVLDLCGESMEILERRLPRGAQPAKWVFPSPRKSGHHLAKLQGAHDQACREAGVSFRLYDLRHTFATRHAATGTPITTLAALLGHSGLKMVLRYVHPQQSEKKDAMKRYEAGIKRRLKVVGG